ncbi:MAG: hypothetical protein R2729_08820 [Bryobacteraceae bacterium]
MTHLPDRTLLLGELSASEEKHLSSCPQCARRQEEIAATIAAGAVRMELPSAEAARARLIASIRARPRRRWIPAAAAAALVATCGLVFLERPSQRPRALPDPALTPGSTVAVAAAVLCGAPEQDPPPVDPRIAKAVFSRYGVAPAPRSYELDYLITPALGGSADAENLWPQPYRAGEWNSRVKDALEDRLRAMVCSGELDLATAQRELAGNWVEAYRRRFHTERPLLNHIAFVKDRPWE